MSSGQKMLSSLVDALRFAEEFRTQQLKSLTHKQRVLYNDYEVKLAKLQQANDVNGIEKLKEKFNKEFND